MHYKPNVKKLQKLLNSNHALKFSVQYDVERQDEGGEIEVRLLVYASYVCNISDWLIFIEKILILRNFDVEGD